MSRLAVSRIVHPFLVIALLGVAFVTPAAPLDLVADAVVGKATMATPSGGATSAANIIAPGAAAEDPVTGALWVADEFGNRVLRFSSAAAFVNGQAADLVLGQADFTSATPNRGGTVAANALSSPSAVAVDQAGRVYVADTTNHRVVVYRPPFSNGMAATWVVGQADFTGGSANRGGTAAADTLNTPTGLALDGTGNLFVADSLNNRVLKYTAPAVTGASATKVFGQANFVSNGVGLSSTGLSRPMQVTIDASASLWVADRLNNRVLRYDQGAVGGDTTADLVLCQASFTTSGSGTTASTCNGPSGIVVDLEGVAWVVDFYNSRVLRFTALSNGASATAVIGQAGYTSGTCNQGLAAPTASTLCNAAYGFTDRAGNLIVSDRANARVLRYDVPRARVAPTLATVSPAVVPQGGGGFTLTVTGAGFYGGSVVNWNGSPRATQYLSPGRLVAQVLATDLAVAGPHAVTVMNPVPGGGTSSLANVNTYVRAPLDAAADHVLGQHDFTSQADLDPAVGEEQLGTLNAAMLGGNDIHAVAVDPSTGRIFVADTTFSRVLSWPGIGSFRNAQPADIVIGQPDEFSAACNTGGIGAATLCNPYGVAVDASGALWVGDSGNHRVLRFTPPLATGKGASQVFGQGGSFTTAIQNNGGVSANSLRNPRSVLVQGDRLFVDDSGNYRILVYEGPTANFTADVVLGQPDMTTSSSSPASASRFMGGDAALATDAQGRLHLVSAIENRVLRFSPPFANGMAADLVLGQASFTTTASAITDRGLSYPAGLAFDPGGNLLVSDLNNHRVLRYRTPLASGMAAQDLIGQPDFVTRTWGTSATKLNNPWGIAMDRVGNLVVADFSNARVLAFDRPFSFVLDPATDLDGDGIPNGVEVTESRDPYTMDNDVFANARLFAMQQYRDFLNREGDPSGIQGWSDLVAAGTYSRLQVVDAFLSSQEFAGNVAPVVRLYFATFLRVPDYAGMTYNAGLVRAGTVTMQQLADYFTTSPEFAATYGTLDNTAFVTLLYNNVLSRAPDSGGLAAWVALLQGGMSRGQVLLGFSDSPEYQAAQANDVFVTMMYAGMLRRTPEASGFNAWVAILDAATLTREQVINGFFLSTEYHGRFLP